MPVHSLPWQSEGLSGPLGGTDSELGFTATALSHWQSLPVSALGSEWNGLVVEGIGPGPAGEATPVLLPGCTSIMLVVLAKDLNCSWAPLLGWRQLQTYQDVFASCGFELCLNL
jgi:hypothetical protein